MIPKQFHFIWIGPKPLSEQHRNWISTWEYHHPDWEIRIWGNSNLPRMRNQREFDRAQSWAGKADILRLELVHEQGGVYLDTDMECLQPIDELLVDCHAFVGRADFKGIINNCIFGGVPGNDFTTRMIAEVPRHFRANLPFMTGPALFTRYGEDIPNLRIFEKRTFSPLTHAEKAVLPIRPHLPGSYAIHWYDESWVNKKKKIRGQHTPHAGTPGQDKRPAWRRFFSVG